MTPPKQPPLNPRPLQIVRPWEPQDKGMYRLIKAARQMGQHSSMIRAPQAWTGGNSVPSDVGNLGGAGSGGTPSITFVSVANIDDPRTELNARTGDAAGSLLLLYDTDYSGSQDAWGLWRADNSNLTEVTGFIVDSGDGLSYTAGAGRATISPRVLGTTTHTLGTLSVEVGATALTPVISIVDGTADRTFIMFKDGRFSYEKTSTGFGTFLAFPNPTAFGADLTITFPALTGTVLLSTTPYTSFPDFSFEQSFLGSDAGGTTAGEIRCDGSTMEVASGLLKIIDNGVGPTQVDETASFTWTGTHDFSGGTVVLAANSIDAAEIDETANYAWSGANTHSGTEAFAADSVAFIPMPDINSCVAVTSAGTVAFTVVAATSTTAPQIQAAWTGMGAAGSLQTADIYFPIPTTLLQQFGKACRVTSSTHCVSKTAGDANSIIESSGIKQPTQTANSMTVSFAGADLVTDTTDRVTSAATDTDSFTIDWTDTAFSTSAPVYVRFQMARKAASASTSVTMRVAFDCALALITYDNNS